MKKFQYLALTCALLAGSSAALAQGKKGAAGDAAKGKAVYEDNCAVCHNAGSTEKKMGPGLKGVTGRLDAAKVAAKINEGGGGMPPYKDTLSDAEKANLIAYLKSL